MTLFTPNYSWAYPELTDAPNGPSQFATLALAIDAQLKTTDNTVAANAAIVTATGVATSYTPTITGFNNNNMSTKVGRYFKNGKCVELNITLNPQATADLGTGVPNVSLPVQASASQAGLANGFGRILDGSGVNRPIWGVINPSATTIAIFGFNSSLQLVSPGTAGYSWGNSSQLDLTIQYESV
jgi:hypothetical protein